MSKGDRQRHIDLGWKIIAYKLMYYNPELIGEGSRKELEIDDHSYDALEMEYLALCERLSTKNTVVHKLPEGASETLKALSTDAMMEPDLTRPSVQLVLSKYGVKK